MGGFKALQAQRAEPAPEQFKVTLDANMKAELDRMVREDGRFLSRNALLRFIVVDYLKRNGGK